MLPIAADFKAQVDDLHAFLVTLPAELWSEETSFKAWTPWDVVAHLHYFDLVSCASVEGESAYAVERDRVLAEMAAGREMKDAARDRFEGMSPEKLLAEWHTTAHALADRLGACEPKRRLPWFGPDMGVSMFTTARLMETWAHGQEVYDLAGVERANTDRIKHIVTIGVKTFGWTFVNRKQEPPGPPPYVHLEAPSGEVWAFGEPSDEEVVRGSAVEFCQVVTQVRNVADTALEVTGPVATAWMAIAQCFAGGAADPPAPGTRGPKR